MAVTRYYKDCNRKAAHEMQKEHGCVFTFEQVRDVLELVKEHRWPDASWSDDECNLWSLVREVMDDRDW